MAIVCMYQFSYQSRKGNKNTPHIIYTSRTHQQLKQSINQLKKLPYDLKMTILSSRDQSCINPQLKELKGKDLTLECRKRVAHKQGSNCKYLKHQKFYEDASFSGKIMDLEEITNRGKIQAFCPYYYSKTVKSQSHIIFMPYNYLFQQSYILEENGLKLQNSILIIDEGHNIQQSLERSKQYTVTLNILSRALGQISEFHQEKIKEAKTNQHISLQFQDQVVNQENPKQKCLATPLEIIQFHASYITLLHYHFQTIEISLSTGKLYNVKEFIQMLINATQSSQFGPITKKLKLLVQNNKNLKTDCSYRPFWALQTWINLIDKMWEFHKIYEQDKSSQAYKINIHYQGSDIKLDVFCLDPSIAMKSVINQKPYSIILTSGTLSPLKTFPIQLKIKFATPVSCPHILSQNQVQTYILTSGPNMKLNFSYENRSNQKMHHQFGLVLAQIVRNTKNGVVVFFPSYQLLQQTINGLTASKLLAKIYESKNIYVEKKQNSEFNQILNGYLTEAVKPRGAVLFALIRGKISEGLDFADEKCRAVIIVGVPYPARNDIKVVSKMHYLNQLVKNGEKQSMNGQQWYLSEAIRSINQGIGRIIRHKKDYGKIYLLDQRYGRQKPDLKNQLSSWAKNSLKIINKYSDLADDFKRAKDAQFQKQKSILNIKSISGNLGGINRHNQKQVNLNKSTLPLPDNKNSVVSLKSLLEEIKQEKIKKQKEVAQQAEKIKSQEGVQQNKKQDKPSIEQKNQIQNILIYSQVQAQVPQKMSVQKAIFTKPRKKYIPIDQLQDCSVCLTQKKLIRNTQCPHRICQQCWQNCLKNDLRCPLCRVRIREKFLIRE